MGNNSDTNIVKIYRMLAKKPPISTTITSVMIYKYSEW